MIWTGILLLICHVIATIGSENYLTWTKDVQHSVNTVSDSDGNYRTRAELRCPDCLRASYSYTEQAKANKAPVYAWSKLGRKLPTYSYQQQNRKLPNSLERPNWLAYKNLKNYVNRKNRFLPKNAWSQAFRKDYQDTSYQQPLNPSNLQQLNQNRGYSWSQLGRQGNRNVGLLLNYLARQGQGARNLKQKQRQGYRNPGYTYSRLNRYLPRYLNQNRQAYNSPNNWKDRLNYNNPSSTWNRQSRLGYKNLRKQQEWNVPPYFLNLQDRQAYKPAYPLKLQNRLYKRPSYSYQQNLYQVPTYSATLNQQRLNRGAWKNARVQPSLRKRQAYRPSNLRQQDRGADDPEEFQL